METWYEVDDEHDRVGDDKSPRNADTDPSDLLAQLDPVAITLKQTHDGMSDCHYLEARQEYIQPSAISNGIAVIVDD